MDNRQQKMAELINLLKKHAPQDGICETPIDNLITYRVSEWQKC